jgi:hypothetical protein
MQSKSAKCSSKNAKDRLLNQEELASQVPLQPSEAPDLTPKAASSSEVDDAADREKTDCKQQTPSSTEIAPSGGVQWPKIPFEFATEEFSSATLQQMALAAGEGPLGDAMLTSMTSVLLDQKPRDQIELMLLNQVSMFNSLAMKFGGYAMRASNAAEIETFASTLNKTARTFAGLVDVLQRYKSGGEPKLLVQNNVSVGDGGQAAVVNNIAPNGPASDGKVSAAPPMIPDQSGEHMEIIEPAKDITPVSKRKARGGSA